MNNIIHVLIINNCLDDVKEYRNLLCKENTDGNIYHVSYTNDFNEALISLVRNKFDVVLMSHATPNMEVTASELIGRANAGGCRTPVIIVDEIPHDEKDEAAMQQGAVDCLYKSYDLMGTHAARVLKRSIKHAIQYHAHLQIMQEKTDLLLKQVQILIKEVKMHIK